MFCRHFARPSPSDRTKAEMPHPDLFEKVGDHIVALDNLQDFKPQHISNTVLSFVKAEVSYPGLFEKVGDHIVALDKTSNHSIFQTLFGHMQKLRYHILVSLGQWQITLLE